MRCVLETKQFHIINDVTEKDICYHYCVPYTFSAPLSSFNDFYKTTIVVVVDNFFVSFQTLVISF